MPSVTVNNGMDLHYEDDDFIDPWTPHGAILMQHFVLGSSDEFHAWVPTLAQHYRVLRMDRRGYGQSGKPGLGYEYQVQHFIDDFRGFLDALAIERVHFVGQSLGGMLGAWFALAHPERLHSLTMVSSPCFVNQVVQQAMGVPGYGNGTESVMKMGSWAYAQWMWNANLGANPSVQAVVHGGYLSKLTAMIPAHLIASIIRMVSNPAFDLTPRLAEIKVPTLLLSPGAAPSAPLEEQQMMARTIPDCEQVVFEGAPHMIALDMPQECAAATLDFVRRHS
jgi:pimeloyl-ACP methyl ester carboxylesterase